MGLINRCSACGLNYTPHGLDAVAYVMALCEKCTRKLIAWLSGAKEGLEEDNGQQKAERAPDSEP